MKIRTFILILALIPTLLQAKDTVIVVGGIQHEALVPVPTIEEGYYLSNSYLDLGVRWNRESGVSSQESAIGFQSLELITRAELTQWPMLGYDPDFGGYGLSHLHVGATFDCNSIVKAYDFTCDSFSFADKICAFISIICIDELSGTWYTMRR